MTQAFERIVQVKVGPECEVFTVHTERLSTHMFYFSRLLSSGQAVQQWSLPTITPRSFHLLLDYVYGGTMGLSWATNEEERLQLVDAWILGDMVGATSFSNLIMRNILTNAIRPGQGRIFPNNDCIARAYAPDTLEKHSALRRLFVDLYVHFGTPEELNVLLEGPDRLRDFWFTYCDWARSRDEHDELARKHGEKLYMFNPAAYYNRDRRLVMPEPLAVTRAGTKAYLCHYDGVNTIVIEDGERPMFIHRELSELRHRILLKCKPREFHFPAGWRKAVVIFLKWLYCGRVTHECHNMKDFIRAYKVGLDFHNPQFVDDILTGIVSFYTRNHMLPSRSEIALAYTITPAHCPLRIFLVCWTLTHHHHDHIDPTTLPTSPTLRAEFAADLAAETAARTASMTADLASTASPFPPYATHPRLYADEMFSGDTPLGGSATPTAPYYGDDICRFHTAHPYAGYKAPLANSDPADPRDPAVRLFGYSTKLLGELASTKHTAATSSAATGYVNPANDILALADQTANPCHALLRKRNCYGAIIVGYIPRAPAPVVVAAPPLLANTPATAAALAVHNVRVRDFGVVASTASAESPYTSPTSPRFTAAFPAPQQQLLGVRSGVVKAFNALGLPRGWQQRRCADGRAYFVRFFGVADAVVGEGGRREVTWVDPRAGGVVWRREDQEVVEVEGSETEADEEDGGVEVGGGGEEEDGDEKIGDEKVDDGKIDDEKVDGKKVDGEKADDEKVNGGDEEKADAE